MGKKIQVNGYTYELKEGVEVSIGDLVEVTVSSGWQDVLGKRQSGIVTSLEQGDYQGPCQKVLRVIKPAQEDKDGMGT